VTPSRTGPDVLTESASGDVAYRKFSLLDRALSFTIDLSAVGCGCNAAVYLVQMTEPGV
jgi:hypothetical protein